MLKTHYYQELHGLVKLRWWMTGGCALVVMVLSFWFTLSVLPLLFCLAFIALSNFFLRKSTNPSPTLLLSTLISDVVVLTILLGLSGGPSNPLSSLYLLPIAATALFLPPQWTWRMVCFSTLCYALLFPFHQEIPELSASHLHHHPMTGSGHQYSAHLYGMFFSFPLVSWLTGYFLSKMSQTLQEKERHLAKVRVVALRQEELTRLTALTAGAAHELGTPLGTIALAAEELSVALKDDSLLSQDASLIVEQTERCKAIIQRMSLKGGELPGEMPMLFNERVLVERLRECSAPWKKNVHLHPFPPVTFYLPLESLLLSLTALIKNGIEASEDSQVELSSVMSKESISIQVKNSGALPSPETMARMGEPFFTTKGEGKGMGLGVFLVRLFAERVGGSLSYSMSKGGLTATLTVPTWRVE